jgi:peptidoglycan/xylan/chitin deacetylase (PgdA/CDA1 family)
MSKVTLTFDNGPNPDATPAVLDCLARHNVKATFFVLGCKVSVPSGRALAERAAREGHWIGNHTYTHGKPLGQLDSQAALQEFERAESELAWVRQPQKLFRPHGGGIIGPDLLHAAVVKRLQAGAYSCVLWNCVPGDWRDPDGWVARAIADCHTREWSLVVLHDISAKLALSLDAFLARLRGDGFAFTQDFPPDCLPIVGGEVVLPLEQYVTTAS